jgi:hypothetical protein
MKYLLLFLLMLTGEMIVEARPPVQTVKVYVIHKEKRPFVRKPVRKYLRHKRIQKKKLNHFRERDRVKIAPRQK